jgi:hypothetical protein
MARFVKRGSSWFCQIRRVGHKGISRTFDTKAQAERWALGIEVSMGIGTYQDNREALSTSLGECLDRYAREVVPLKKGAVRDLVRVNFWKREALALNPIGTVKQADVALWRDNRLTQVGGSTVTKDLALLSHVFTIAIKEWGFPITNPVMNIRKPKAPPGRDRRLEQGEESKLLGCCQPELRAWVTIAIETAMRRSEMHALTRKDIKGRVAYLPDTKNGSSRLCRCRHGHWKPSTACRYGLTASSGNLG